MALVRCVTEMGMGVDVHGLNYTSAAKRAVFDISGFSSILSIYASHDEAIRDL